MPRIMKTSAAPINSSPEIKKVVSLLSDVPGTWSKSSLDRVDSERQNPFDSPVASEEADERTGMSASESEDDMQSINLGTGLGGNAQSFSVLSLKAGEESRHRRVAALYEWDADSESDGVGAVKEQEAFEKIEWSKEKGDWDEECGLQDLEDEEYNEARDDEWEEVGTRKFSRLTLEDNGPKRPTSSSPEGIGSKTPALVPIANEKEFQNSRTQKKEGIHTLLVDEEARRAEKKQIALAAKLARQKRRDEALAKLGRDVQKTTNEAGDQKDAGMALPFTPFYTEDLWPNPHTKDHFYHDRIQPRSKLDRAATCQPTPAENKEILKIVEGLMEKAGPEMLKSARKEMLQLPLEQRQELERQGVDLAVYKFQQVATSEYLKTRTDRSAQQLKTFATKDTHPHGRSAAEQPTSEPVSGARTCPVTETKRKGSNSLKRKLRAPTCAPSDLLQDENKQFTGDNTEPVTRDSGSLRPSSYVSDTVIDPEQLAEAARFLEQPGNAKVQLKGVPRRKQLSESLWDDLGSKAKQRLDSMKREDATIKDGQDNKPWWNSRGKK